MGGELFLEELSTLSTLILDLESQSGELFLEELSAQVLPGPSS